MYMHVCIYIYTLVCISVVMLPFTVDVILVDLIVPVSIKEAPPNLPELSKVHRMRASR